MASAIIEVAGMLGNGLINVSEKIIMPSAKAVTKLASDFIDDKRQYKKTR